MAPVASPAGVRPNRPPPARPPEPLRPGDNLTRVEFERRAASLPDGVKAELIDGVVYMPPPVSAEGHGRPHLKLATVVGLYEEATPGVAGYDNASVRMDLGNMPQPDLCLCVDPALGGRARVDADDYLVGSPELVVEVAASSASYDLHQKLRAYRRNGVGEYVVWQTYDGRVARFVLRGRSFDPVAADADGVVRSVLFPGLWIDTAALAAQSLAGTLAALRRGLASPEHAAFVADLARRRQTAGPKS